MKWGLGIQCQFSSESFIDFDRFKLKILGLFYDRKKGGERKSANYCLKGALWLGKELTRRQILNIFGGKTDQNGKSRCPF